MFVCAECGAAQPGDGHCPADGTPLVAAGDDLLLGQTIGAYRVARLLGIGGMGRVYKAVHPQIGSRVAIKVLSRECSDRRELVERFFAEAKAVNVIRHEGIVNVLDLATLPDGRPFIIMEYLDGAPLASIIEEARRRGAYLPLGGVARLAADVLDALGAAHGKMIVHRDLKPDNIFVTPAGRPKVLDFGIAKLRPELGGSSTHTGSLLGTPHYMSPEQAAGRPVDHRADLYAMGVILFECTTLRRPFEAPALFDLLRMHVELPPPSPRGLRADLPVDVEHVILTALAKQPDHRFASAHAMSMALQHATQQLPADAWAAVTPIARTGGQSGWQPTPPASWASSERAKPGTVTSASGELPTAAKKKRGMGVWMVIAGIVLVGGGVGIGVMASGSGSGSGSGSETGSGSEAGSATEPVAVDQPKKPEPVKDDDDGEDVVDADMLDGFIGALTPQQKAQLPPQIRASLAKYGSFAKMPKAERAKLAGAMLAIVQQQTMGMGDDINNALAGGGGGDDDAAKPAADWFKRHDVEVPSFDAKHVDVDAAFRFALAEAKKNVLDAKLTRFEAENVFPDGHADLTLPGFAADHGSIDVRFTSPKHAAMKDPKVPANVRQERRCEFRVEIEPGESEIYDTPSTCDEQVVAVPHCTMKQLWARALAKHHGIAGMVAEIGYWLRGSRGVWDFTIYKEDHTSLVSEDFPDDCT